MADVKNEILTILDAKVYTDKNKMFNSTEQVLEQAERIVFDNFAVGVGDMRTQRDGDRPKGFYKVRHFVDIVLLIKKNTPHQNIETTQQNISAQFWDNDDLIEDAVFSRINEWSEEIELNQQIWYSIGTLEILRFIQDA